METTKTKPTAPKPQPIRVEHGSTRPVHAGVVVPVTASGLY